MLLCVMGQSPVVTGGLDMLPLRVGVLLFIGTVGAVLCSCRTTFTERECGLDCGTSHITGVDLRTE